VHHTERVRLKVLLLMVSDKELCSDLIQLIEQGTSYYVLLAEDSQQALEMTKDVTPDLLLLDYRLQETNDTTFYKRIQAIKKLKETPALIINAPLFHQHLLGKKRRVICLSRPLVQDELLSSIAKVEAELSHRAMQGTQRRGFYFFLFRRKA